jgi:MFS family permease
LLSFGFIYWLFPSIIILFLIGVSIMLIFNLGNALVQTLVPDKLRGRVMGVYSLAFFGLMPLGSLWVGLLAEYFGEPLAVVLNGAILLVFFILIRIFAPRITALP